MLILFIIYSLSYPLYTNRNYIKALSKHLHLSSNNYKYFVFNPLLVIVDLLLSLLSSSRGKLLYLIGKNFVG